MSNEKEIFANYGEISPWTPFQWLGGEYDYLSNVRFAHCLPFSALGLRPKGDRRDWFPRRQRKTPASR